MDRKEVVVAAGLALALFAGVILFTVWYQGRPHVYIRPVPFPQTIDEMQVPLESQVEHPTSCPEGDCKG